MTSELRTRTISAVVLGTVALTMTLASFWSFAVMCAVGGLILAVEWWTLTKHCSRWWLLVGVVHIGASIFALLDLHKMWKTTELFLLVWGADIAAYAIGKPFGKHKIAPRISPGKSWEGLAGATLCTILLYNFFTHSMADHCSPWISIYFSSMIGASFAIVALLGDFFESYLKRKAGVKDSGKLIPGHGGLFALLPCAIYFFWLEQHAFPYLLDHSDTFALMRYSC